MGIETDEGGNVKVTQIKNTNIRMAEALKSAVEQWKFCLGIVDNQPKAVEAELPITFIQP